MSSSAITTQVAQLKIGSVQNQADTSSIYSAGVWSFKNSTALTSVTITDAGNVGIRTSLPAWASNWKVVQIDRASISGIGGNFTQYASNLYYDGTNYRYIANGIASRITLDADNGNIDFGSAASGVAGAIATMPTQVRIDASGNLLVGSTTNPGNNRARIDSAAGQEGLYVTGSGSVISAANNQPAGSGICYVGARATDGYIGYWVRNGVLVGSIYVTSGGTSYNTTSDYRLKEDVQPMAEALSKVAALKPCTYKWKVDGSEGEGFIAHELAEVCPAAVTGEKDAVNEDGSIKAQGIDPSKLVALLTAAIQELSAKVDAQAAEIEALKAKP